MNVKVVALVVFWVVVIWVLTQDGDGTEPVDQGNYCTVFPERC